ncbi:MAG: sugar phosphate nucleotidyltransferase [Firmicutes bacterium]|nr:sugar phosphate nucleotidyltransferase [Bacillota bacterium]
MHIILLSGGSGKRLWPLSNDIRSKQFIKIFKTGDGGYESMVQRMYRQIKAVDTDATVTVATSKSQISQLRNQIGDEAGISVEPCRRDTFPAIALATAFLHDVQGVGEDEPVVVCPVDPYVERDYFEALRDLSRLAQEGNANLTVMGIEPTYPSEKYGYVIPENTDKVSAVRTFKEKPDAETAARYISQGALWNAGVFAYRIGYVLQKAHELMDFTDYDDLFSKYETVRKISFDYAVAEKEQKIRVMRFAGRWKDMGTWNTLTEAMEEPVIGKGTLGDACENVDIVNELDVPILVMGLKNAVVAASPEGILVTDKEQSSYIKPYVDAMDQQVMFAEKSWGSFQVLDVEKESLTILVTLKPGHRMNYHSHDHRDEVWNVISGSGRTIVDGMEQKVHAGDVITMQAGCRHTIISDNEEIRLIEVQLGKSISVHDKKKYALEE